MVHAGEPPALPDANTASSQRVFLGGERSHDMYQISAVRLSEGASQLLQMA